MLYLREMSFYTVNSVKNENTFLTGPWKNIYYYAYHKTLS